MLLALRRTRFPAFRGCGGFLFRLLFAVLADISPDLSGSALLLERLSLTILYKRFPVVLLSLISGAGCFSGRFCRIHQFSDLRSLSRRKIRRTFHQFHQIAQLFFRQLPVLPAL